MYFREGWCLRFSDYARSRRDYGDLPRLFDIFNLALNSNGKTISSEKNLIAAIRRLVGVTRNRNVIRGMGDDCAILRPSPNHELLVTTDFSLENVHFRREWHPAESVGHRCLARGLSDIAAMGGEPLACFLSLGLPPTLPQRWADEFLKGLHRLARLHDVQLAGGDTSSAPQITADIIVIGQVPKGQAILRSGARPGDRIYVTGDLGGSTADLKRLFAGGKLRLSRQSRHFFPEPRLHAGAWLRQRGLATSMIDLSDGLSIDLDHICEESGVSAIINSQYVPVARGATLDLALHGGEDYELLFTASPKAKIPSNIQGLKITQIGVITRKNNRAAIRLLDENGQSHPLPPLGWQHFSR
jgi:thiamine-monophosphate kinase